MLRRRGVLALLAAGAIAPAAGAHTLYNQWVVYRRKHLVIGSHRQDPVTYELALEIVEILDHLLPEAAARPARAPRPERLASLLATRQFELAVLAHGDVAEMRAGAGRFSAYGAIPLSLVTDLRSHMLVGHAEFPERHAWLVAAALREVGFEAGSAPSPPGLPRHPGSQAHIAGVPFSELADR